MTSLISIIGPVKPTETNALSGVVRGLPGTGRGLRFAAALEQKLQDGISDGSDILSQIAGMLQSGTPMNLIVDNVAKNLSGTIANALGQSGNIGAQRTLQRALASALAPPGSSPPTSGITQAAELQRRLKELVTALTSEIQTAGQQSEFSGQVLDASTARETPAQQTKPTTGERQLPPAVDSSFANSLLSRAVASAQSTPHLASADVLTRMLVRAGNAAAQRGEQTAAKPSPLNASQTASSSVLFQRLIAIVAEQHAGSQNGGAKQQAQNPGTQSALSVSGGGGQTTAAGDTAFAAQVAAAPVNPVHAAVRAGSASYTAIDPQTVIDQVVKGIAIHSSGDSSEVRLRLQPEHLGDVSLKLTVSGNTISANVVAQNADVRDVLMNNQHHLARSLSEAGLSLGNFSVDVSGGNPGFAQQQTQQHRSSGRLRALGDLAASEDANWADPRIGPPIVHGPRAAVLDYLV